MAIIESSSCRLVGSVRDGHAAFLGIPFAVPPVGELRFAAPRPAPAWDGIRTATTWGNAARQGSHAIPGFAASGPQDEDCLYLNVYTPASDDRKRPVMFWIHGGGFTHGTAAEPLYDGGPLATRGDVVVVTINYRLGALGYLYPGEHFPGAGLSANAGQLDQVAALEWVRDNISGFGGDPGNVTIFGESAGAAAVGTLLAMPSAQGLFHRAILQSGTGRAADAKGGAAVVDALLKELGLGREQAAQLRTIDAGRIIEAQAGVAAQARGFGGMAFGPVVDGETLLENPPIAVRDGRAANVPMLIGTNRDEVKLFAASQRREPIDDAALAKAVRFTLPKANESDVAGIIDLYRTSRGGRGLPDSNLDLLDAIGTDARFRVPAMRLALSHARRQADTYAYLFTYASPARHGALGACHALEMPFVFGTTNAPTQDRFAGTGPGVERLSETMMDAWLSFARGGNPGEGWTPYGEAARETMVFDLDSHIESDPFADERRAIEGLI